MTVHNLLRRATDTHRDRAAAAAVGLKAVIHLLNHSGPRCAPLVPPLRRVETELDDLLARADSRPPPRTCDS